jgi:predicted nucleic acid-binding protein
MIKKLGAIAKSWDLELTSTVMVLYEAFIKDLISYDELVEDLAKLTRVMWISTDVITEVIKRAKKVVK